MWILLIIGGMVVILSPVLIMLMQKQNGGAINRNEILADLGLAKTWKGENTTPFYKWGWKKTSTERVWGERIVKKAFQKAGVWLSKADLNFFEKQCKQFAEKKKVDQNAILHEVDHIIERTEKLTSHIAQQIDQLLETLSNLSIEDAKQKLKEAKVKFEPGEEKRKYASTEFRRIINAAGLAMFQKNSPGLEIELQEGEKSHLKGFESWEYWLKQFRTELAKLVAPQKARKYESFHSTIQNRIVNGLLKAFLEDVNHAKSYRKTLEQQIENKDLPFRFDEIERAEQILYTWQFREDMAYNETDHQKFRSFMLRSDLSHDFQAAVLNNLKDSINSIEQLINQMPRKIIFLGANQQARAYAAKLYQFHFRCLLDLFGNLTDVPMSPPATVMIPLQSIKEARHNRLHANAPSPSPQRSASSKSDAEGKESETPVSNLAEVIEKHQRYSVFERDIDATQAESIGWLVDLPIAQNDLLPDEQRECQSGALSAFRQFDCDSAGDIDFNSNSSQAKKNRDRFFAILLESVTARSFGAAHSPATS